jgi:hypothetical protein
LKKAPRERHSHLACLTPKINATTANIAIMPAKIALASVMFE